LVGEVEGPEDRPEEKIGRAIQTRREPAKEKKKEDDAHKPRRPAQGLHVGENQVNLRQATGVASSTTGGGGVEVEGEGGRSEIFWDTERGKLLRHDGRGREVQGW